jgi:hypothetical protein
MRNARFDRPRAKVRRLLSFTNGDNSILVPYNFPIRVGCLVKQDAAYRKTFAAENGTDELFYGFRRCYFSHYRYAQQIPLCVLGIAKF